MTDRVRAHTHIDVALLRSQTKRELENVTRDGRRKEVRFPANHAASDALNRAVDGRFGRPGCGDWPRVGGRAGGVVAVHLAAIGAAG